jgi:hypothetical protein
MYKYADIKEMAKRMGVAVPNLLALSPKNDPMYTGTPTDIAQAEWFLDIWQKAGYTSGVHLRRVHYWTVSQSPLVRMHDGRPYENTEACWKYLTQASKMARYLGLVDIADIRDNKNPLPHIYANYSAFDTLDFKLVLPDLNEPEIELYGPGSANAQPFHMEVWTEKSTMDDVLLPVCERYLANLVTFEGEASITACYSLIQRIKDADKPVRIWYISDFDPAGNSMPVATARKVEFMLEKYHVMQDVRITPIALTKEQIDLYALPRIPIKDSEKRAAKFEQNFGEGACELDALEALYPGTLGSLVRSKLIEYFSEDAANYARQQAAAVRDLVRVERDAIMDEYRDEISALDEMLEKLRNITIDTSSHAVVRQEKHVPGSASLWMFDSTREYLQQIQYYKAHKGQGDVPDSDEE